MDELFSGEASALYRELTRRDPAWAEQPPQADPAAHNTPADPFERTPPPADRSVHTHFLDSFRPFNFYTDLEHFHSIIITKRDLYARTVPVPPAPVAAAHAVRPTPEEARVQELQSLTQVNFPIEAPPSTQAPTVAPNHSGLPTRYVLT